VGRFRVEVRGLGSGIEAGAASPAAGREQAAALQAGPAAGRMAETAGRGLQGKGLQYHAYDWRWFSSCTSGVGALVLGGIVLASCSGLS
jgi:hypothetical protein